MSSRIPDIRGGRLSFLLSRRRQKSRVDSRRAPKLEHEHSEKWTTIKTLKKNSSDRIPSSVSIVNLDATALSERT